MPLKDLISSYKTRTISRDLTFGLILIISLVIIVLGIVFYTYTTMYFQRELRQETKNITQELAEVLVIPLWNIDHTAVKQITKAYLNSETVVGINVYSDLDEAIFEQAPQKKNNLIHNAQTVFKDGTKVGQLEIFFSKDKIKEIQKTIIYTLAVIIFAVLLTILLGTHFIMRSLLKKPLEKLIFGIRNIASGNYMTLLSYEPQAEINEITQEVNIMAKQISSRTAQLQNEIKERKNIEQELKHLNASLEQKITELRKTEQALSESEQKYRSIFENALEGIFQTTVDGNFVNASPSMARLLGFFSPEELIESVNDTENQIFVDPNQRKEMLRLLRLQGIVTNFECRFYRKDYSLIWVLIQVRAITDTNGQITHLEGFVQDITARKKAEAELKEAYQQLEQRVQDRTAALKKAYDQLRETKEKAEAATKAKSEFLANMSHEIRTPLNVILSATELVLSEEIPTQVQHYLHLMQSSAHSLLGIINDILDFSKIEAGMLEVEERPFDLDEVLDKVVNQSLTAAVDKEIEILVDIDPKVPKGLIGDPLRLQQILNNLLSNALKFTSKGGFVLLGVHEPIYSENHIRVSFYVQDTGIGIDKDYVQSLFQPFSQSDTSSTRKYQGTGLGLSICKQLVDMMNGEIWAKSVPDEGSTFYFYCYFGLQKAQKSGPVTLPADLHSLKILVIDDCSWNRKILRDMLLNYGFEVDTASSGEQGLYLLRTALTRPRNFDLLITDLELPLLDGIQTARRVKKELDLEIPAILMTAFGKESERAKAQEIGIRVFLTKPVFQSTLINAILDTQGRKAMQAIKGPYSMTTKRSLYMKKLQGAKVLLVEDNPTNQEIVKAILEKAQMEVDIAENGKEALNIVNKHNYDALLMDIQMPEMDGYEATQKLRQNPRFKSLPIIAMTAHAMKGDEQKCLKAGMNDYVSKPISQERLFHVLWKTIQTPATSEQKSVETASPSSKTPAGNLPSELPGIKIERARNNLGLSADAFHSVLINFYQHNKKTKGELQDLLKNRDWKSLGLLAHSIKGGAANIGAYSLQEKALQLEKSCFESSPKELIENEAKEAISYLERVLESIKSLLPQESLQEEKKNKSSLYPDEQKLAFNNLAWALEQSDPVEVSRGLKEVRPLLDAKDREQLESWIQSYDYDRALNFVEEIKGSLPLTQSNKARH